MLSLSGALDPFHLNDLLEWLHLTRATGRLFLSASGITRTFDLRGGKVVFVSSSRAAERLASWLLRKNLAPRQALLRALAISQTCGEPFTEVVLREAGLSPQTLVEAGRSQATALVSRVLKEERVFFRFDPQFPVRVDRQVNLDLACSQLIMEAAVAADTRPPTDHPYPDGAQGLEPEALELVFWEVVSDLDGETIEAQALAAAHDTLLKVGSLLARWITQGPPLLPLSPADAEVVARRLQGGEPVQLTDSPTLAWDLLALVNGLDSPGFARACGLQEAWVMAGDDGPLLVRLILENSRWRREKQEETDLALRRQAQGRAAAARVLAPACGLNEDVAATAAVLPLVLLELVITALSSVPWAAPALQRGILRRLLPLVGKAASNAAGLPEILRAAVVGEPLTHPGAKVASLAAAACGEETVAAGEATSEAEGLELLERFGQARLAARHALGAS